MEREWVIEVTPAQLEIAGDMLRYDDCYRVERKGENFRLYCLFYTPERWKSFGVEPRLITELEMTRKELEQKAEKAVGFTEGLRLAQTIADLRLVEGRI